MARLNYTGQIQIDVTPDGVVHEAGRHGLSEFVRFIWTAGGYIPETEEDVEVLYCRDFEAETVADHVEGALHYLMDTVTL